MSDSSTSPSVCITDNGQSSSSSSHVVCRDHNVNSGSGNFVVTNDHRVTYQKQPIQWHIQGNEEEEMEYGQYGEYRRGDIRLLKRIHRGESEEYDGELERTVSCRRSVFLAEIISGEEKGTIVTVESYKGPEASEEWKRIFRRYSEDMCASNAHLLAINRSRVPSLIMLGGLVPARTFAGNGMELLCQAYLATLAQNWGCAWDELWLDGERGVICRGPKGPDPEFLVDGWLEAEIEEPVTGIDIFKEDVLLRYFASFRAKKMDRAFLLEVQEWGEDDDAWEDNHLPESIGLDQPTVFCTLTNTPIAVGSQAWVSSRKSLVGKKLLENKWTRFRLVQDNGALSLVWNSNAKETWLSQASSIFHARGISLEEDLSSYKLISSLTFLEGQLLNSIEERKRRLEQPIYLFVCPPPPNTSGGHTSSFHYWSLQESGQPPLPPEICNQLGLPIEFKRYDDHSSPLPRSWYANVYKLVHRYQLLRGFDPTTADFARHLELDGPIFEPINDSDRFQVLQQEHPFAVPEFQSSSGCPAGRDSSDTEGSSAMHRREHTYHSTLLEYDSDSDGESESDFEGDDSDKGLRVQTSSPLGHFNSPLHALKRRSESNVQHHYDFRRSNSSHGDIERELTEHIANKRQRTSSEAGEIGHRRSDAEQDFRHKNTNIDNGQIIEEPNARLIRPLPKRIIPTTGLRTASSRQNVHYAQVPHTGHTVPYTFPNLSSNGSTNVFSLHPNLSSFRTGICMESHYETVADHASSIIPQWNPWAGPHTFNLSGVHYPYFFVNPPDSAYADPSSYTVDTTTSDPQNSGSPRAQPTVTLTPPNNPPSTPHHNAPPDSAPIISASHSDPSMNLPWAHMPDRINVYNPYSLQNPTHSASTVPFTVYSTDVTATPQFAGLPRPQHTPVPFVAVNYFPSAPSYHALPYSMLATTSSYPITPGVGPSGTFIPNGYAAFNAFHGEGYGTSVPGQYWNTSFPWSQSTQMAEKEETSVRIPEGNDE